MSAHLVPVTILASVGHRGADWGPGGWWWGPVIPLLWLALTGLVVWLVVRRTRPREPAGADRAGQVLAERYAAGELSTDEYRERRNNLR